MSPRRAQTPITIRSDRAAARLRVLTRNGRSQVSIVEEALDRMPVPAPDLTEEELDRRRKELTDALSGIPKGSVMSMKEFDALEYDENGDLR